jgi:hypothetical protein
VNEKDGPK